jgi:hypothetical protein
MLIPIPTARIYTGVAMFFFWKDHVITILQIAKPINLVLTILFFQIHEPSRLV